MLLFQVSLGDTEVYLCKKRNYKIRVCLCMWLYVCFERSRGVLGLLRRDITVGWQVAQTLLLMVSSVHILAFPAFPAFPAFLLCFFFCCIFFTVLFIFSLKLLFLFLSLYFAFNSSSSSSSSYMLPDLFVYIFHRSVYRSRNVSPACLSLRLRQSCKWSGSVGTLRIIIYCYRSLIKGNVANWSVLVND